MNLTDAAQIVLAEVRKHEAFAVAAQALQSIGSLDQALAESQARIDKSKALEAEARGQFIQAQDATQAALDHADKVRAEADVYRLGIHEQAHRDAEQTALTARASADALIADATARRQGIEDMLEDGRKTLDRITAETAAKQAALDDLTTQLDAIKAKIA